MDDILVSKEQIRDLIKREGLKPNDLFDEVALKELTDKARADGYAEAQFQAEWKKETKEKEEKKEGPDSYLDPKKNPWIKTK
jgi:hypothetical protein